MSRSNHALRRYIDGTFAPEDALLQRVHAKGEELRPGMQISAGEGKLLYMLAKLIGAKRILEIGCFMGYSALWMARALPEDGELITLEASAEYADLAEVHFAASGLPIQLMRGKAAGSIAQLAGPFDLVFIDADKLNYLHYLQAALPLLRTGGLMMGDNTLLFGAMYGEARQPSSQSAQAAMRAFNEQMADSDALEGVLIPTDEGFTVARKR